MGKSKHKRWKNSKKFKQSEQGVSDSGALTRPSDTVEDISFGDAMEQDARSLESTAQDGAADKSELALSSAEATENADLLEPVAPADKVEQADKVDLSDPAQQSEQFKEIVVSQGLSGQQCTFYHYGPSRRAPTLAQNSHNQATASYPQSQPQSQVNQVSAQAIVHPPRVPFDLSHPLNQAAAMNQARPQRDLSAFASDMVSENADMAAGGTAGQADISAQDLQQRLQEVLGSQGTLERYLGSFQYRAGQLEMSQKLGAGLFAPQTQVVLMEAGTGLGKTYAYLLPLMLARKNGIISTYSISLQYQVVLKDIPKLLSLLGLQDTVAYCLFLGRNNYLCHYKLSLLCNFQKLLHDELQNRGLLQIAEEEAIVASFGEAPARWRDQEAEKKRESLRKKLHRVQAKLTKQYSELYNKLHDEFSNSLREQSFSNGLSEQKFLPWLTILSTVLDSMEKRLATNASWELSTNTADHEPVYWGEIPLFLQYVKKLQQSYDFSRIDAGGANGAQASRFDVETYLEFMSKAGLESWLNLLSSSSDQCDCESCLYRRCNQCWYMWAQNAAERSHIVVINHALLTSKLIPRLVIWRTLASTSFEVGQSNPRLEEILAHSPSFNNEFSDDGGKGITLPNLFFNRQALIIDEAHYFEPAQRNSSTHVLSSKTLLWIRDELKRDARKRDQQAMQVRELLKSLLINLGSPSKNQNPVYNDGISLDQLFEHNVDLYSTVEMLRLALSQFDPVSKTSEFKLQRQVLIVVLELLLSFRSARFASNDSHKLGLFKLTETYKFTEELSDNTDASNQAVAVEYEDDDELSDAYPQKKATWTLRHFEIQIRPVSFESCSYLFFRLLLQARCMPVFISATLKIAEQIAYGQIECRFNKFKHNLGLNTLPVSEHEIVSPFDYANNSLVWGSSRFGVSDQNKDLKKDLLRKLSLMQPVLEAVSGGILFLVTSYKILDMYKQLLTNLFSEDRVFYQTKNEPIETPLSKYKSAIDQQKTACMVGTLSCWTGIDLPGKYARVVVIDKLVFQMTTGIDKEHEQFLQTLGRKSYFELFNLPKALVSLKQGLGRLIRSETDWGVVILAFDFQSKNYRFKLEKTLEPMPYYESDNPIRVLNFIRQHSAGVQGMPFPNAAGGSNLQSTALCLLSSSGHPVQPYPNYQPNNQAPGYTSQPTAMGTISGSGNQGWYNSQSSTPYSGNPQPLKPIPPEPRPGSESATTDPDDIPF